MITFFVPGIPVPKGSARAFLHSKTNKQIVRQTNAEQQKPWSSMIGFAALQAGCQKIKGPVAIEMEFYFPRPKGHFGT